ncbi:MAG: hypothetical protein HBSAPP03_14200 [Phycisphaerae bacterium]|nr:MAG: hypothetical protein HBSAPP03_14200 [Phycisphaerae bacterium]
MNRRVMWMTGVVAVSAGMAFAQNVDQAAIAPEESSSTFRSPLLLEGAPIDTMRVTLNGRPTSYENRDNCPVVTSLCTTNFSGDTFTAQGGFAESEIAAVSYTLPGHLFPLRITLMEVILAQSNATVQTTTQWSIIIYDGLPNSPQPPGFPIIYSSDGTILPHVIMGPGTRGTNVQISVDPNDPEQIYIYNPTNLTSKSFSVGFRIDRHNNQTANPCFTAPPSSSNAFPCTDNTVIGCGSGYAQLNFPNDNWLWAVNCGANGCPPNGGWTRLGALQADQNIPPFGCFLGCRPRGDWVMRVTWDPVNCPQPNGACCFGVAGCFIANDAQACTSAGGTWKGPGTTCGTFSNGQFPGCAAPPNSAPVANAGPDQNVSDSGGDGYEIIAVDGSNSFDPDAGDFIARYLWSEGGTVLQDGPAFMSVNLPVGVHTLTLRVFDSFGAFSEDTVVITIGGPPTCDADVNCDGSANGVDVEIQELAVGGDITDYCQPDPDFNQDGAVNGTDVEAVELVVGGGPCP